MPKPNYSFEKRQRELAKKRKKEDKAARKAHPRPGSGDEGAMEPVDQGEAGSAVDPGAEAAPTASSGPSAPSA